MAQEITTYTAWIQVARLFGSTFEAAWAKRCSHKAIVFDDKMWIAGGLAMNGVSLMPRNDVWYSKDGYNWTLATNDAGWVARKTHELSFFNNRLWILQGVGQKKASGDPIPYSDNWCSSDGVKWNKVTDKAPFAAHSQFTTVEF